MIRLNKDERQMSHAALPEGTQITIRFDLRGGEGEFPPLIRKTNEKGLFAITIPGQIPVRGGYAFSGWLCNNDPVCFPMDPPGKKLVIRPTKRELVLAACWRPKYYAPVSAPYMMVSPFPGSSERYDLFRIDWKCVQDAENTYWAVHSWYGENGRFTNIEHGSGYAGFQNVNGRHFVILSIWDTGCGSPVVEYGKNRMGEDRFTGEGEGVHALIPYPWKTGVWYTADVRVWTQGQRSMYGFFVRETGREWEKIAVISLPKPGLTFRRDIMFQEDFGKNNYPRSSRIRNMYARNARSGKWETCKKLWVSNMDVNKTEDTDLPYDCDIRQPEDGRELWIQSGGDGFGRKCSVTLPCWLVHRQEPEPV